LTAISAKIGHSGADGPVLSANPALVRLVSNSTTTSTRRRSKASATAPPRIAQPISGAICTRPTMPTSSDEPVRTNTW
jgi:hypothetical protein